MCDLCHSNGKSLELALKHKLGISCISFMKYIFVEIWVQLDHVRKKKNTRSIFLFTFIRVELNNSDIIVKICIISYIFLRIELNYELLLIVFVELFTNNLHIPMFWWLCLLCVHHFWIISISMKLFT